MPYEYEISLLSQAVALLSFLSIFYAQAFLQPRGRNPYEITGMGKFFGLCSMLFGIAINFVRGVGFSYYEILAFAGASFSNVPCWTVPVASLAFVTGGLAFIFLTE